MVVCCPIIFFVDARRWYPKSSHVVVSHPLLVSSAGGILSSENKSMISATNLFSETTDLFLPMLLFSIPICFFFSVDLFKNKNKFALVKNKFIETNRWFQKTNRFKQIGDFKKQIGDFNKNKSVILRTWNDRFVEPICYFENKFVFFELTNW